MKKFLLFLGLTGSLFAASQQIVTHDPADPYGKNKTSPLVVSSGVITTTNSVAAIAVVGTSTNTGVAGLPVKTTTGGQIDSSLFSTSATTTRLSTNFADVVSSGSANTWSLAGTLTTTITNGTVIVIGQGAMNNGNAARIRIRDSTTNNSCINSSIAGVGLKVMSAPLVDTLTTATKTYYLDISSDGTSQTFSGGFVYGGTLDVTNAFGIRIVQIGN